MEIKKIDKWDALVHQEDGVITIVYAGRGGAIMSGTNQDEVENEFIKGMTLSGEITNMLSKNSPGGKKD